MRAALLLSVFFAVTAAFSAQALSDRTQFLDLARKGWVYELRSSMWRPEPKRPPIRINGRDMAGAALCVVGEAPHPHTKAVIDAFRNLVADIFGKPMPMRFAGADLSTCGTGRLMFLRLYSGLIPHRAFNDDLRYMDDSYGIGLSRNRDQFIRSPAQAQTFFGRNGRATHLVVKQPVGLVLSPLEQQFFTSIMIEELYQAFTFGMDILHFDRKAAFASKLEEFPVNLRHLPWDSPMFMEGLLRSNPTGLCQFDIFMMHAVAQAPVERTNSDAFLRFIETRFDDLLGQAKRTISEPTYAQIFDWLCATLD